MDVQDELTCSICYRMAVNVYECQNLQCRKPFCKECYNMHKEQLQKSGRSSRCPYCMSQPYNAKPSPVLQQKISQSPTSCQHCHESMKFSEIQGHLKRCDKKIITCRFCYKNYLKQEIARHTQAQHQEKMVFILQASMTRKPPEYDPNKMPQLMKIPEEQRPKLGISGKFYCRGPLASPNNPKGCCGPATGENCLKCMQLDLMRRGLTKGYLVNGNGEVCWSDGNKFNCEIMFSKGEWCSFAKPCRWCQSLNNTKQRYYQLLK